MSEETTKIVYFRDRAKELGMENVYNLINNNLSHGAKLEPENPKSPLNLYTNGDKKVWEYIIENQ